MSDTDNQRQQATRWLPWICLVLLTLPFHSLWTDFEQVRRGLLLLLAGSTVLLLPQLPRIRGEKYGWLFIGSLILCAITQAAVQAAYHSDETPWSFQAWESAYRIAHWFALLILARVGAMYEGAAIAVPLATIALATSTFGLLQRFGLMAIGGYGLAREPVSTFGNLNVASEWTAVSGIALAVLFAKVPQRLRWLPIVALVTTCAYLVVNPSRSGKVAMLAGLVVLAIMRRKQNGYMPLIIAAAGCLLGTLISSVAPRTELDSAAMQQELERGTVTLQIRFEIAKGSTQLFSESPIYGKGPGQFAIEYPRYRSQEEIEASSFGRQFATEVRTAHDDWLELLVDGGLIALVLFAVMLLALQRGTRDKTRLIPMFVLLLLMLVRAPIGNAPAAAIAFMLIGSPLGTMHSSTANKRRGYLIEAVLGLCMIALGILPVAGNTAFAPYLRAKRDAAALPTEAAANASWWMPYEPRWLQIRARESLNTGDIPQAARFAARALALRPFSPPLLLLLAEILSQGGRYGEAIVVADEGLRLDPKNPELHALKSTVLAELGDVDRAIEAVAVSPHPLLRAGLAAHFADLATRAYDRNENKQAKRYLIEHAYLSLAELLGNQTQNAAIEVRMLNRRIAEYIKQTERTNDDLRFYVTGALEALDLDNKELAATYGAAAKKSKARLTAWQVAILGDQLDRLKLIEEWSGLLRGF